eukprot:TRINITY_DN6480_c0_g2_i9.p1 TRINITY_DN6480_c0_g2~~TRINITY_DN6480_c0_g2_i9.p1  ORF type:complete len:710 (-),score=143.53 TRINITY_DN6480_c0_g2_i9:3903-6032(-)
MSAEAGWHTVSRNKRGNKSNTARGANNGTAARSVVQVPKVAVVKKEVEVAKEGDYSNFWDALNTEGPRRNIIVEKKSSSLSPTLALAGPDLFSFMGLGPKLWRSILNQLGFSRELILFSSTSKIFFNLVCGPGGVCDFMWWFYFGEETKSYKEYKYALVAKLKSPQKELSSPLTDLKGGPNQKSWSQHIHAIYLCQIKDPKKHIRSLDTMKVLRSLRGNSHASIRKALFKWALSEKLVNYAYFLYVKSGETITRLQKEGFLDFNLHSTFDFLFMDMTGTYTFMLESQLDLMQNFMSLLINYYRKRMFEPLPLSESTPTQNLSESISKIIEFDPLFTKLLDYYVRRCSIYGKIDELVLTHGISYLSTFNNYFYKTTDPSQFPFLYTQGTKLKVDWIDLCWKNDSPDFVDFLLKNYPSNLNVSLALKMKELLSNILLLGFDHWWKILVDNKLIDPLIPELPNYLHTALTTLQEKKSKLMKLAGHKPASLDKYALLYLEAFKLLHQHNPALLKTKSVGLKNSFLHYNLFNGEVMSYLIGLGLSIENENAKGLTPLQMICYSQKVSEKQVRLLVRAGASLEPSNQNLPPLAILMMGSKFSTARYLISRGAPAAAAHAALQGCLQWFEIQPRIGKLWDLVSEVEILYVELRQNMAVLWALVREGRAVLKTTEIVDGKEVKVDVPQWAVAIWKLFHDWMPHEVVRKIIYMIDVII